MPSDPYGKLSNVRNRIQEVYNSKRDDAVAMDSLRKLLLMVLFKITGEVYAPNTNTRARANGTIKTTKSTPKAKSNTKKCDEEITT